MKQMIYDVKSDPPALQLDLTEDRIISEGVLVDVVKFFQRLLNPRGIERFAERIGIKIPIGQMFQETTYFNDLVKAAFPYGGELAKNYMAQYHEHFISIPPEQAVDELESMGVISTKKKCLTIFGTVICWGEDETSWQTYALVAGGFLLLGYLFLKS